MKNPIDSKKPKIQKNIQYDTYNNNDSKFLFHCATEINLENIHSSESLSNIIDIISNNSLNLFYQDDSTNFKRNIDNLNLKFYLETEKILSSNNLNSNNLFLILFKQITLYIKEIERLNIIILGMKKDEKSQDKMTSFMEKREMDFENKEHIIQSLKYSNNTLEKKINNLILSENNLKKENMRLIQENMFYKKNNSSKSNMSSNIYEKIVNNNKFDIINNRKIFEFNKNFNLPKNNTNYFTKNKGYKTNNNSLSNNHTITKMKKEKKISKNIPQDTKSIIITVKKDGHPFPKRHRRNYSDQIGVGVLIQDNIKYNNNTNGSRKIIKNNSKIKKFNKNIIISTGASTPKSNPNQIKNNHTYNVNIKKSFKLKYNKSTKNDNKNEEKKTYTKKVGDFIPKNSKNLDFLINQDKDYSLTKYSSTVFNKSIICSLTNGNVSLNNTENNYDFLVENEIDELSMLENLLRQCKDYIKNNIYNKDGYTNSISNIIKINCNNNFNSILKKAISN